jgi:hypothetical protein
MLFVLVCFPSICFATSYASAKNGVWSDPTAWTPNGNPGNGDSTTITHSINIDSNVTIGVSPASGGTAAIALSGGGQLTLSAGIVLTSRGDITATGTGSIPYMLITMNAGSVIEFDSSAASSPASTLYVMKLGTSHNTFQKLVCNGTSNSHCTIRSNAGGGNGRIAGGDAFLQGGNVDATYTDFLRIGDSSNKSIAFWNSNGNTIFRLQNCTFNSCGKLGSTGTINKASTFYLYKVLMSSTVGSTSMTISGDSSAITGQSEIAYCYFDKIVELFPLARTICHYNYFGGSLSTTSAQWYTFEYNLVDCANNQINTQGDVTGCYLITSVAGNNHGFYMERTDINQTYNGIIVEDITNSVTGDFLFPGPSSSGKTYTIKNCIELTNSLNKTPGKLISCLGFNSSYAASIVIEHNTVATTDATTNEENGLVNWGETGTGKTGMITSLKNNIAYTPSGGTLGTFLFRYTGAVQDAVLAANCDYNARYNLSSVGIGSGNNGAGYLSWDSTAPFTSTPGTHDITSDPNFYAPTRKLGSWGAAIWGTDGTATAALAIIKADPTQIYNSSNARVSVVIYVMAHG